MTSLEPPHESTPESLARHGTSAPASIDEDTIVVPGIVHVIRGIAPGDVVVVQMNRRVSVEQAEQIQAYFKDYLPNNPVILLPPELTLVEVKSPE